MSRRTTAREVADALAGHGHADSVHRTAWTPGYRTQQASPRTVRCWHDGPDEQQHLDQYAAILRTAGYAVTPERPPGSRPRLRITHP
ncbi:hypothetical protein [Streptomyces hebeiensis]